MFNFEILKSPNFTFNLDKIALIFKLISLNIEKTQNGVLNIVFVSSEDIRELNKKYRDKDFVTDVLSFHYYDDFSNLSDEDISGELIFCEEKIILQAKEYGLGEEKEFYKLLIHSILHIIGYDHENDIDYESMKEKEGLIWDKLFN